MEDQEVLYRYNSKGDVVLNAAGKRVAFNRTIETTHRSYIFNSPYPSVEEILQERSNIINEEELERNIYISSTIEEVDGCIELNCIFKKSNINFLKAVEKQEDALLNWELHKLLTSKKESENGN